MDVVYIEDASLSRPILSVDLEGNDIQRFSGNREQGSVQHLQVLFSDLSWAPEDTFHNSMVNKGGNSEIVGLKSILDDIKLHLRRVYEMVGVNVQENREVASDVRYIANQMGSNDSRIDDNERDLGELMGTVDIIKEKVLKMAKMTQCSHCQDTPDQGVHPMEETSVVQLALGFEGKKMLCFNLVSFICFLAFCSITSLLEFILRRV